MLRRRGEENKTCSRCSARRKACVGFHKRKGVIQSCHLGNEFNSINELVNLIYLFISFGHSSFSPVSRSALSLSFSITCSVQFTFYCSSFLLLVCFILSVAYSIFVCNFFILFSLKSAQLTLVSFHSKSFLPFRFLYPLLTLVISCSFGSKRYHQSL